MSYIIEILRNERCGQCELSVEFMNNLYCPVLRESMLASTSCKLSSIAESDESFVKNHDIYKDLLKEKEELEEANNDKS